MKNRKIFIKILSAAMLVAILLSLAAPVAFASGKDERSDNKIDFAVPDQAYYTAIGSGYTVNNSDLYSSIIAKKFSMQSRTTLLNQNGLRISDIRALLDKNYKNDDYGKELLAGLDLAALRSEYINAIKYSDLITVDLGVEDFTSFAVNQILALGLRDYKVFAVAANNALKMFPTLPKAKLYDLKWSQFKGKTGIADIDEFLESIEVRMTSSGMNIDESMEYLAQQMKKAGAEEFVNINAVISFEDLAGFAEIPSVPSIGSGNTKITIKNGNLYIDIKKIPLIEYIQFVVETYIYAFANYAYNYAAVIEEIRDLNPNATIVMIGKSNFLKNAELAIDGVHLDFNEYANDFVYMLNQVAENYAKTDSKSVYVPCLDMETVFDATATDRSIFNIIDLDRENSEIRFKNDVLTPSVKGHAYIAEQVIASLNIICDHKYNFACQQLCSKCSEKRETTTAHTYDNATCDPTCNICSEEKEITHVYDGCFDAECNVCKFVRENTGHVYSGDCDIACNNCGGAREALAAHTYDNACDEFCNVCNEKNESAAHTFGEWVVTKEATETEKGEKTRTCSVCGATESEETDVVAPEKKTPVVAIVCILIGALLVIGVCVGRFSRKKSGASAEEAVEEAAPEATPDIEEEVAEETSEEEASEDSSEENTDAE